MRFFLLSFSLSKRGRPETIEEPKRTAPRRADTAFTIFLKSEREVKGAMSCERESDSFERKKEESKKHPEKIYTRSV